MGLAWNFREINTFPFTVRQTKYAPTENWSRKSAANKAVWVRYFKAVREVGLAT
jgi:hypothetical protein